MPEPDNPDSPTHGLQHISRFLPRTYQRSQTPRHAATPVPLSAPVNDAFIITATTVVLIATPAAIYFLANIRLLPAAAALAIALTAAYGPKLYADFIQPKASDTTI